MTQYRRIISWLLTAALVAGMLPAQVFAAAMERKPRP